MRLHTTLGIVQRWPPPTRCRPACLDSDWGEAQPRADVQNAYLAKHSWQEYARWHLGLTDGANDETKARYAFIYADLRRLHRTGLIQLLDAATGVTATA